VPLQNRVTPFGAIEANLARGNFMGNRGILHGATRELGHRRWAHKNWIICLTKFRGRHRGIMTPGRYTELFFLDEAVAISAGHRPCYECRRSDYHNWQNAWQRALGLAETPRAKAMDNALHQNRIDRSNRENRRWRSAIDELPNGSFVSISGTAHLVLNDRLLPWQHSGYGPPIVRPANTNVTVLTPSLSVATLRAGFSPHLHRTALSAQK
tara:strand:- start:77 stop:709 length:633 start_codon:yes stop_codon:yes gene_type:complete